MNLKLNEYDKQFGIETHLLCGMDEAGRGPLMGPVVAACVILPDEHTLFELNDSKKIKENKRYEIALQIKEQAIAWGVGMVSAEEIDSMGIQKANFTAFQRCLSHMLETYKENPELILLDGNYKNVPIPNYLSIVKGDSKSAVISAASIIAKTERDRYICEVCHPKYPMYHFDKHKGYGTKTHTQMIIEHGLTEFHRKTFCKNFIQEEEVVIE